MSEGEQDRSQEHQGARSELVWAYESMESDDEYLGLPPRGGRAVPGEGWLQRCAEFVREAHLRRMEPFQAQRMVNGDLLHQALLLLPWIHAGLVNTLPGRSTGRIRPNGQDRRPSNQRLTFLYI